jgi:hypothetical protein
MNDKEYLQKVFKAVQEWAKDRSLASPRSFLIPNLSLSVGCPLIERQFARGDARAFFHVLHKPGRICASPRAARLPHNFIVGLMLHEIGHPLAQNLYGSSEQWDADKAIRECLGINIRYGGALILEFVPWSTTYKILKGSNFPLFSGM